MASNTDQRPLTRANVAAAHGIVAPSIHKTPVLTNATISALASTPQDPSALVGTPWEGKIPAEPKLNLYFKVCRLHSPGRLLLRIHSNHQPLTTFPSLSLPPSSLLLSLLPSSPLNHPPPPTIHYSKLTLPLPNSVKTSKESAPSSSAARRTLSRN